ncbi:transcription factor ABORTED MICROSPORES [Jatropha curcas]|uniref:transcription factor ABORTED MICROSPORES n=1 Tax=Jatropha curcas TaxID=180498 RepID=UPI001893BE5F|nr:transcription factor ABORTED MICROSPORES [Jatropha curcas]XP_037493716.1 transcription factor ABORTED MICROSPORES [Jatropha curcas]
MNVLQSLIERLRPLVGLKGWDYCVLWIFSDDQRFLEWMECCCGGTEDIQNGGDDVQFPLSSSCCRDLIFQHQRTKSCELLAQLPTSIPLDSGIHAQTLISNQIHAQTLISNQPRWLNFSSCSDSSVPEMRNSWN